MTFEFTGVYVDSTNITGFVHGQDVSWPCDEKRETGISFDNGNDKRRAQQGMTVRKDVGQNVEVAGCRASSGCLERHGHLL